MKNRRQSIRPHYSHSHAREQLYLIASMLTVGAMLGATIALIVVG